MAESSSEGGGQQAHLQGGQWSRGGIGVTPSRSSDPARGSYDYSVDDSDSVKMVQSFLAPVAERTHTPSRTQWKRWHGPWKTVS